MTYGDQVLFCHINVAPARHTVRDTQLLFKAEYVCVCVCFLQGGYV